MDRQTDHGISEVITTETQPCNCVKYFRTNYLNKKKGRQQLYTVHSLNGLIDKVRYYTTPLVFHLKITAPWLGFHYRRPVQLGWWGQGNQFKTKTS